MYAYKSKLQDAECLSPCLHSVIYFIFSLVNSAEFLSAVCVYRLGWGCVCPDLWTHFAYRLPQVIHGISEGNLDFKKRLVS